MQLKYVGHNNASGAGSEVRNLNWAPSLRIRDTVFRHLNLALKSARFLSTGTSEEKPVQKMGRTKEIPDGAGI